MKSRESKKKNPSDKCLHDGEKQEEEMEKRGGRMDCPGHRVILCGI